MFDLYLNVLTYHAGEEDRSRRYLGNIGRVSLTCFTTYSIRLPLLPPIRVPGWPPLLRQRPRGRPSLGTRCASLRRRAARTRLKVLQGRRHPGLSCRWQQLQGPRTRYCSILDHQKYCPPSEVPDMRSQPILALLGAHSRSVATLAVVSDGRDRHLGCSKVFTSLICHLYSVSTTGQPLE